MPKRKVSPDRRGMGAQSDFIAQQFIPSEQYKALQSAMVQTLIAAGVNPAQLAGMFLVPFDLRSDEEPKDRTPEDR
jgi:hypothetical protein